MKPQCFYRLKCVQITENDLVYLFFNPMLSDLNQNHSNIEANMLIYTCLYVIEKYCFGTSKWSVKGTEPYLQV